MRINSIKLGILGAAALAALLVCGMWYWSGWQIEKKQAELIKLQAQAEQLELQMAAANESYAAALETSQETNTRLIQARLDLIKIQSRHRADLAAARKQSKAKIQVIEVEKARLPELDDRQLATAAEKDLPGAVIVPLQPNLFEVNRQALIQVGILALDLKACREMNLLVVKERDTAQMELDLQTQITASWEEQFQAKEEECLACANALHTTQQLEANLAQRMDAEKSRADAWERKWKIQRYMTWIGFGAGAVGGIVIGSLAQ